MISTPSFTFNSLFEQFEDYLFIYQKLDFSEKEVKELWKKYKDSIVDYIKVLLNVNYLPCSNNKSLCQYILKGYVDFCLENPDISIDFETYWKDMVYEAMDNLDAEEF